MALAAEGAAEAGVPYIAVLPFPDPDAKWPESTRARYRRLVAGAVDAVTLSNKPPRTPQEAGKGIGIRNTALVAATHGGLVVWDEKDRTIGELVRGLERRVSDDVWILPPS